MKITDYPIIKKLDIDQVLLVDGPTGTKQIRVEDLPFAMMENVDWSVRRNTFRGKNLGTTYTNAQKLAISSGTFDDLWLGDYWVIGGVTWRIADFNYWLNTGSPLTVKNHVVIVPDNPLYLERMNPTGTAEGGYAGSYMYTTGLTPAREQVKAAFPNGVIPHSERFSNVVDVVLGAVTGTIWVDSIVDIPTEIMFYGTTILSSVSSGTTPNSLQTTNRVQLALFKYKPSLLSGAGGGHWLRDIINAKNWSFQANHGNLEVGNASGMVGVRPVFALGDAL